MNCQKMLLKRFSLRQVILVGLMLLGLSIEGHAMKNKSADQLETSNVGQKREGAHKRNLQMVDDLAATTSDMTNTQSELDTTRLKQAHVGYEKLSTAPTSAYVSFAPKLFGIKAYLSFVSAKKHSPRTENDGDNENGIRPVLPSIARIAIGDKHLAYKHTKSRGGKLVPSRKIRLRRSVAEVEITRHVKELNVKEESQSLRANRSPSVTTGIYQNEKTHQQHGGIGTGDLSKYKERPWQLSELGKDSNPNNSGEAGENTKYASAGNEGDISGGRAEAEKEKDGKILENTGSTQGNEEMHQQELRQHNKLINSSNANYGSSEFSKIPDKQLISMRSKGILKTFTVSKSNHRNQEGFENEREAKMAKEQSKLQDIEASLKQKEDEILMTNFGSDEQDQDTKERSEDRGVHASGNAKGNFRSLNDQKHNKFSSAESTYESYKNGQSHNQGDKRTGDGERSSNSDFKSSKSDKMRRRADKIGKLIVTNANQKIVFNIYQPYHPPEDGISSSARSDSEGLEDMSVNLSKTSSEEEPLLLEPDKPEEQRKENEQAKQVRYKEREDLKLPLLLPDKPGQEYSDYNSDQKLDQKHTEEDSETTSNRKHGDHEIQEEHIQRADQRLHENAHGVENRKDQPKGENQEHEHETNKYMHSSVEEAAINLTKNKDGGRQTQTQEQIGEKVRDQKPQPFKTVAKHVEKEGENTPDVNEHATKEDHQSYKQHIRKEADQSAREEQNVAVNKQEAEEKHIRQTNQQFSQDANRNEMDTGKLPIGSEREKESQHGHHERQLAIETGGRMKNENEGKSPKYHEHEADEEHHEYHEKLNNSFSSSNMGEWNHNGHEHEIEMQEERGELSNDNRLKKQEQENKDQTEEHAHDVAKEEMNDRSLEEDGERQQHALQQNVQEERHQGTQRIEKETEHVDIEEESRPLKDEHKIEEGNSRGAQTLNEDADRGLQAEEKRPKGHEDETEERHEEHVQTFSGSTENTDQLISGHESRQTFYDQDERGLNKDKESQSDENSDRDDGARVHESNHGEGKNGKMAEEELEENSRTVLSELKHLQELAQSPNADPRKIDISSLHPGTVRILKKLGADHDKELNRPARDKPDADDGCDHSP